MPAEFPSPASDSAPGQATTRGIAVYVIASVCVLIGLLQMAAGGAIAMQMQTVDLSSPPFMLVQLYGSMFGKALIHLAAGVAVFLMRREAIALMGCLFGWLLQSVFKGSLSTALAFNLLYLSILIFFTIQLVRKGKLR